MGAYTGAWVFVLRGFRKEIEKKERRGTPRTEEKREESRFMSSGSFDLVQRLWLLLLGGISRELWLSSSAVSTASPCGLYMQQSSETGSMRLKPLRCGFGVKYFGFLHIRRCCCSLCIFLRGALT